MGSTREHGFDSGGVYVKRLSVNKKTPCYSTWTDIMQRCYSSEWKKKFTTYNSVTLCSDWHDYQKFATWYYNNYKEGFQIDKDILSDYYKVAPSYSPVTCRMIPRDLNMLLVNRVGKSRNTNLPLGVCIHKPSGRYIAWCNNGEGKTINLGYKSSPQEAFVLYKAYKEELIKRKAEDHYKKGNIDATIYSALQSYKVTP